MKKTECLEKYAECKSKGFDREQFWKAFGHKAPKETKRNKFWKRFKKKLPEACAMISVRSVILVTLVLAVYVAKFDSLRFLVSKFI